MKKFILISFAAIFFNISQSALARKPYKFYNMGEEKSKKSENNIRAFYEEVLKDNSKEVSKYMNYPITFFYKGKRKEIYNNSAFYKYYNSIFNNETLTQIRNSDLDDIFSNIDGLMIGNGIIWFNHQGYVKHVNNN